MKMGRIGSPAVLPVKAPILQCFASGVWHIGMNHGRIDDIWKLHKKKENRRIIFEKLRVTDPS